MMRRLAQCGSHSGLQLPRNSDTPIRNSSGNRNTRMGARLHAPIHMLPPASGSTSGRLKSSAGQT
ncbi:MAG: hypothetical protein EBS99_13450 [Betaproteobacteria bacterium]|nr:hypothetical protein [Betaproteobacteria bacterium]